jgi:uncharacterized DUF497 family protein
VRITFDPTKRDLTPRHRGLDFAAAAEVFADRHITVGILAGRVVVIVWTPREGGRRIISMRHAHAKEARRWRDTLD